MSLVNPDLFAGYLVAATALVPLLVPATVASPVRVP